MTDSIDKLLSGREERYGAFTGHARIAQGLKETMYQTGGWESLDDDMREALDMIQHKVARILNGDSSYGDNWVDIAGYARLVEQRLESEEGGGLPGESDLHPGYL